MAISAAIQTIVVESIKPHDGSNASPVCTAPAAEAMGAAIPFEDYAV
jgi:hypothetical protein